MRDDFKRNKMRKNENILKFNFLAELHVEEYRKDRKELKSTSAREKTQQIRKIQTILIND